VVVWPSSISPIVTPIPAGFHGLRHSDVKPSSCADAQVSASSDHHDTPAGGKFRDMTAGTHRFDLFDPPRPLEVIEAVIKQLEGAILALLKEVTA
jgi:hypothetical protein